MKFLRYTLFVITISSISFSQSVYRDEQSRLFGAKDKNGEVFIAAEYDEMYMPDMRNIYRAIKESTIYFFNYRGELINKHHFDGLGKFDYNGAKFRQGSRWGVMNDYGDITIPVIYSDIIWPLWGYAAVSINGQWGISDLSGNLISNIVYDTIIAFPTSVKYSIVKSNNKYGVIDMISGVLTCKCELDDYSFTKYSMLKAYKDGKTGLLAFDGSLLAGFYFDEIRIEEDARFSYRYIYVRRDGLWGVLNERGKILFSSDYEEIGPIDRKGQAPAKKNMQNIILDFRNGREL